jgi:copper chaperone
MFNIEKSMERLMIFSVPKMSCGYCTSAITKGIQTQDASAVVTTDLDLRLVTVQSGLTETEVLQAIVSAGYESTVA